MLRKVAEAGIRLSLAGLLIAAAPFMAALYVRYPVTRLVDDTFPRWMEGVMGCELPVPGARDKVILFSTGHADSLALADMSGSGPTYSASVLIDPPNMPVNQPTRRKFENGDPLYIILTSKEAMVWRFTGDVSRVTRVVATSKTRNKASGMKAGAAGVVGIPAEKVSFIVNSDCIGAFTDARAPEGNRSLQATIRVMKETVPDMFGGVPSLGVVQFPSANIGSIKHMTRNGIKMPGIPVDDLSDARHVVSAFPVENHPVRPGMRGIEDLVASGHLADLGDGHYRVARTLPAFPVGLSGEDAVSLHLSDGAEMPKGDMGDNCVFENGRVLAGRNCDSRPAPL